MLSIKALFDAFRIWMALGCGFMKSIADPACNLAFCHIVWSSDVIEPRKLPLRQFSKIYQPLIILTLNANMPPKHATYQHTQPPSMMMSFELTIYKSGQVNQ
ncbi:hypothetical protein XB02_10515 [Pantoea ananatis]|nr:hypothetical protein XB02_10515 [Pantoea ananatis]